MTQDTLERIKKELATAHEAVDRCVAELEKVFGNHGYGLLTLCKMAVTRIDKDADIIYCLKQRLSLYEEVE